MRYIFREFDLNFDPLCKESPVKPKIDLSRIYASPHTLGLILTYHANYGLSVRKTAALIIIYIRPTTGFRSKEGSVSCVTLFTTYFNFLHPLNTKCQFSFLNLKKKPHMLARSELLTNRT